MKLIKIKAIKKMQFALNLNSFFLISKSYKNNSLNLYSIKLPLKQFKIFFKNKKILNCFNGNFFLYFFNNIENVLLFFNNFNNKKINLFLPLIFFFKNRYLTFNYLKILFLQNHIITSYSILHFFILQKLKFFYNLQNVFKIFFLKKIQFILNDNNKSSLSKKT